MSRFDRATQRAQCDERKRGRLHWLRTAAAVLFLAAAAAVRADDRTDAFRFIRPVQWSGQSEQLVSVTLDSSIYAATRDGFPDLRVFDDRNFQVPSLVRRAVETRVVTRRQSIPADVVQVRETLANQIEVVLKLRDKKARADGLTIHTRLSNFERRVRVFGSSDGENWNLLVDNGRIYDYSRYLEFRGTDVRLPKNSYRWLKVLIDEATKEADLLFRVLRERVSRDGTEEETTRFLNLRPFRMERIEVWDERRERTTRKAKTATYAVVGFVVEQRDDGRETVLDVTVRREPLVALTLQTPDRNFSRPAEVQVPVQEGVQTRWHTISRKTVSRIDFGNLKRTELTLRFDEQRQPRYRIVVQNGDSPPVNFTGVEAEGFVYELLFLAEPARQYRLAYGSDSVDPPDYDTTALRRIAKRTKPTLVSLGPESKNPAFKQTVGVGRLLERRAVLVGAVVLVAVVLAWVLLGAARRVAEVPEEQANGGEPQASTSPEADTTSEPPEP